MSGFSGLETKSPNSRLSILVQFFRNTAKLRAFDVSGSKEIKPFSSRKEIPPFGFVLKRAAPVRMSCFFDFAFRRESVLGYSCHGTVYFPKFIQVL